jgi:hypothetical protein
VTTALLGRRVCDLGLTLERSAFPPLIRALERELERAGISLRPRFYLSTEYGCIERTATIGVLFTDGFPATRRAARRAGVVVRGRVEMLRTLRHEAGHAFCYLHRLYATPRFRRLFGVRGSFFGTYPESWRPGPRARARLRRGEVAGLYAARHPDEDFAVAFQTWLADPTGSVRRWARRPVVLEKLQYVAAMVARHGRAAVRPRRVPWDEPIVAVTESLGAWLRRVSHGRNYQLRARGTVT